MKVVRIVYTFILALVAANTLSAQCVQTTPRKHVILCGWETAVVTPDCLKDMVATLAGTGVSGVALGFNVPTDTAGVYCRYDNASLQEHAAWEKEWFAGTIATMSAAKSSQLPASFLHIWLCPSVRLAWNDDAAWAKYTHNVGVLAYVVKQGGLKGIVVDPEDYTVSRQWIYQASDGTYALASALARARGSQMMNAIVQEYPDITLLCYWLVSVFYQQAMAADPQPVLESEGNLYVPFVNGILDVMPSTVKMVDASEHGYYLLASEFAPFAATMRNDCIKLVAPENRDKYRSQVQVGFGLFEDRFSTTGDFPELSGSKARRWVQIESTALATADEYVWLYGQAGCWAFWEPDTTSYYHLWEELIPGYETATKLATDLDGTGQSMLDALKSSGNPTNLASNPGFEGYTGTLPTGWSTLQWISSSGVYSHDATGGISGAAARATGPIDGCFKQSLSVNPGEVYAVGASSRVNNAGRSYLQVRWLDEDGDWTLSQKDRLARFQDNIGAWSNAVLFVFVPEGAAQLVVWLAADLPSSADSCWFDNVEVYKLW